MVRKLLWMLRSFCSSSLQSFVGDLTNIANTFPLATVIVDRYWVACVPKTAVKACVPKTAVFQRQTVLKGVFLKGTGLDIHTASFPVLNPLQKTA